MILDTILLLAICAPIAVLSRGALQACAITMLMSFLMVNGYEYLTGGYAVYWVYPVADVLCALGLSATLIIMGRTEYSRTAILVLLGFFVCWIMHGLRLAGLLEIQSYWWAIRIVNACQLIALGGAAGVGGGKRIRRAFADRLGTWRRGGGVLATRAGNHR